MSERTDQIWKQHHEALLGFIKSRVKDDSAAEDLLQDVFVRVHSSITSLKENDNLRSWIYQIARNAIIDYYRRDRQTEELPEDMRDENMSESDAVSRLSECVVPFINEISEPYREAVMLCEIEGMTQQALADKLGISLSGAKSRVQRGRAMVKELFTDCCNFEFDSRGQLMGYQAKNCD